jgi:ribosomal protein S18 acetylase RimI-like enzyme
VSDVVLVPVTGRTQTTLRRLGPGDESVVERLAERMPRTALLHDERTIFVVAFDGDDPVGFVFGYDLPRRHGDETVMFVYELDVEERYRRRGIATALLAEIRRLSASREAFVLTEADNDAANATYAKAGGMRSDSVMWEW